MNSVVNVRTCSWTGSKGIHLVIATRKDPLLPLPRWRVGAEMTDLREADLRFTHEEATAWLSCRGSLSCHLETDLP
jgi:ATP/maltotriose-dependent transcriptional regulator MalT